VQRLIVSLEGSSKAVLGIYHMKVQFGWYVTGGDEDDDCGQSVATPGEEPMVGQNSSHLICSPVLWFLPDKITVNATDNRFIYELEGVDLLVRGQEFMVAQTFGSDTEPRFFVSAVLDLACNSHPPFTVEFKTRLLDGNIAPFIAFKVLDGEAQSPEAPTAPTFGQLTTGGPFRRWTCYERPPLAVIHEWLKQGVVALQPETGKEIGITMNYDSTFDRVLEGQSCEDNKPEVGRLIIWADAIPSFRGNLPDIELDKRMVAFYCVNGGNCSPVYSFNPMIRWNFQLGLKSGGGYMPAGEKLIKSLEALSKILGVNTQQLEGIVSGARSYQKLLTVASSVQAGQMKRPTLETLKATISGTS